jgi:phenylacetate-CoA ligase
MYQQFYENIYFPFFESLKKRNTYSLYKESLISQGLPCDSITKKREQSLRQLLKHAVSTCDYYKKYADLCDLKGNIDITRLPILTKDDIKQNYTSLIASSYRNSIWSKATGGSTGQPLQFAYTKESYEWRVAMSKRGYSWAGAHPGAKQAYIWGVQLGHIGRLQQAKESLHHFIDRHLYFNCFDFDESAMAQCLAGLNRFKPECVIGYTNPLYNLALFIAENSKISFRPRGVICAAEKVHPYQRDVIERVFGAKVFNTYGSREFMLIAAECEKHEGLHVSAENLIVEIIKDDGTTARDGETGRIIVTDLHNYGMPFIRYEIGDLGVATSKSCSCGRGLPLIADVVGRSLDVIRTPEGKVIPGEFFPHLMKDFTDIYRFQVIQEKIDLLVVKLAPVSELSETTKKRIDSEVRSVVGPSMVINFEIVSDMPLTATGKYRVTISHVAGE